MVWEIKTGMRTIIALLIPAIVLTCCTNQYIQKKEIAVTGTADPVISLNGKWKFTMNPCEKFFLNEVSCSDWHDIQVPGECAMQGFAIKHNTPYVYKTSVAIPADYAGKVIKLKFEGVYSYARVWVNGIFVRDHSGGFTSWECIITDKVIPGNIAWLTVEFTDRDNEISYGSGYAKHQIGGILRNVSLVALPENYPKSIQIQTDLDKKYRDADLIIRITPSTSKKTWISFRLFDQKGNQVKLNDKKYLFTGDSRELVLPVNNPIKWDSEHPNLYTLIMDVFDKSIVTATYETRIGFRKIEIKGNLLLVNGQKVKLRGACRHDVHPLLGRCTTVEYDKMDVLLAKEANINFIRTSHYPPSESFLKYCDQYGIYVEDETAVCFVNTNRRGIYKSLVQSGPEFSPQYLSQVEEMVGNHQNHPSVIIWSIGNENAYEDIFRLCYDYIKSVDSSRPVMFSYSDKVPENVKCFDIISMHYPPFSGTFNKSGMSVKKFDYDKLPVLYDEWAHVACYDKSEILCDQNVRNFWGQSLDSMWTNIFDSDGGLGGAIWGMIDETFMLPDTMSGYNKWWGVQEMSNGVKMYEGPTVGYGEWGIVDTWRRKKPEFWNTKKAYSPVRILTNEITEYKSGSPIVIPVYNRFNSTDLKEITTKWEYKGKGGISMKHNIHPNSKGEIHIPGSDWEEGQTLNIKFFRNDTFLIDEYNLRLGSKKVNLPSCEPGNIKITDLVNGNVLIEGKGFKGALNKKTGLLEDFISGNDTILKSGPYLNYKYPVKERSSVVPMVELTDNWKLTDFSFEIKNGCLNILSKGNFGKISVDYWMIVDGKGTIVINYSLNYIPEKSRIEEFGLKFITGNNIDSLIWDKKAYWNAYPPTHLGMPAGRISIHQVNNNQYRQNPESDWNYDNKSFYYNGLEKSSNISYIAGAMKENIYNYALVTKNNKRIEVISDGDQACRFALTDAGNILYINPYWDYNGLQWGNYMKNQFLPRKFTDTIYLRLN
jgi:beta-galactosidase